MTIESAYHAFSVHCESCSACERVRVDIARHTNPRNFDRWHERACRAGRELLEEWKASIDIYRLGRSPLDIGRIA